MGLRRGQVLALAIGLAPVLLLPLTWTPHGPEPWMRVVRSYAAPILLIESVVILLAVADGLVDTLRRFRLPWRVVVPAVVLALVAIGSAFLAPVPRDALLRTSFWMIHVAFGLSVLHFAGRRFAPRELVWSYAIGFVLFSAVFIGLLSQVRAPNFDWTWDLPAFTHVRHVGYYALAVAGLATGLMAISRTPASWAIAFALAGLAFALALWTGSRGAIFGAAGGLIGGLLFVPAMRLPRAWAGLGVGLALAWLAVSQLPAPAPNMGSGRLVTATVQSSSVSTGRTDLWMIVAKAVAERPVFGHGEGQMRHVATYARLSQPHNVILQVLLAWGVVGLLCIIALVAQFLRAAVPAMRSSEDELAAPFVAMLALASLALIDGTLYHIFPLSIFAACVGLVGSRMLARTDEA